MIAAAVLVLAAAPQESVVRFSGGLGFFITQNGAVVTTHDTAVKIARPEAELFDGTTVKVLELEHDDAKAGVALLMLDGDAHPPLQLARRVPPVGSRVTVIAQDGAVEGDITAVHGDEVSLDAGVLAGAPVVDEQGEVVAVLRGPGQALAVGAILDALAPPAPSDGRVRNLGISLAFFLVLMGWWRYRLKGRRS